jgi:hypothetical protein
LKKDKVVFKTKRQDYFNVCENEDAEMKLFRLKSQKSSHSYQFNICAKKRKTSGSGVFEYKIG